jgi:hypothetical protein
MMKILKILYYYYYSVYQKIDDEPHAMTVFALSISQSFAVIFIIQLIFSHFFCYFFSLWQMIGIMVILLIINSLLFLRSGRGKKIVKASPPFIISHSFSKMFALFFFIITLSSLFFGPVLLKNIYENCH